MTTPEARAFAAYLRSEGAEQTEQTTTQTIKIAAKAYVVLSSANGLLAVYRIKPDGNVRRMVRYPKALTRML